MLLTNLYQDSGDDDFGVGGDDGPTMGSGDSVGVGETQYKHGWLHDGNDDDDGNDDENSSDDDEDNGDDDNT